MFQKHIEAAVEKALDRRTIRPDRKLEADGYYPLPAIMGALYSWVFVPFMGEEMLVEVRYPRSTQLPDVDKLHSIAGDGNKELTRRQMIDVMNIQEECCRAVLNRPTFNELEQAIHEKDYVLKTRREKFEEMRERIKSLSGKEKSELQKEIDDTELFFSFILPDDTMASLTNIALGIGVSDIKKLTKEKLITAHMKARMYNGRPSDYIPGIFTDGDRQNIDDYAALLGGKEEAKSRRRR